MTWSFNKTLPTAKDRARLALGDTVQSTPLLEDETISAMITEQGEPEGIARLAEALAAKYGQMPTSVRLESGLTVGWADRVRAWMSLAARMRQIGLTGSSTLNVVHLRPAHRPGYAYGHGSGSGQWDRDREEGEYTREGRECGTWFTD